MKANPRARAKFLRAVLILPFLLSPLAAAGPRADATATPEAQTAPFLKSLTPEEKVGQLFLVSFDGASAAPGTPIYELVTRYHVGGVVLRDSSGNFTPGAGEAAQVVALSSSLQQAESDAQQFPIATNAERDLSQKPAFIPLFIAAQQDGNGFPDSQWATDLTQLPSEMAIGATWNPALAQGAGQICGQELAAIGVNLLLGPSLDVLERPNPGTAGDLGASSFGGDPFWVGQMGSAYIQGVHQGSGNQVAVVATHFPGIGGSDRNPDAELATVLRALDQMEQIDLAPFFSATSGTPGQGPVADGVLVSPLRYEGLQGNLRETSLPVSLDSQALGQLLSLPQIAPWRRAGGLTVSDSLGADSIRRFYDPTETTFPGRQVARDALLAGNDLLLLEDFKVPGLPDETAAIEDTINFFVQKDKTDPAFAQDVDQAVGRILTLKSRLYPQFALASVEPSPSLAGSVGKQSEVSFNIEKEAVTLLSPASAPGAAGHPVQPPTLSDHIIFFTDSQVYHPCTACKTTTLIPVDALQQTVKSLYGPGGSGQIDPTRIHSYSFDDLEAYLSGTKNPSLDTDLGASSWIVALLLSPSQASPSSAALSQLLSQRADLLGNRKVVVFAMDAPYYLDSTEVSKLSAYYALYSKVPAAIEVAARTLFGEITPSGSSPVSIDGLGYDLVAATSPDPAQIIPLSVGASTPGIGTATPTAAASPVGFKMGDTLVLEAGPVVDQNHHDVPDGSVVVFSFAYPTAGIPALTVAANTHGGMAQVSHLLDRAGELQMTASSQPALRSTIINLQVGEKPGFVTAIAPTPVPSITAVPAPSPTLATATPAAKPAAASSQGIPFSVLVSTLVFLGFLSVGGVWLLSRLKPGTSRRRSLLCLILGGLVGYDFVALGLSGTPWAKTLGLDWAGVLMTFLGTAIAFGLLLLVPALSARPGADKAQKDS